MANLPKIQGDSIYADKDGVYIYKNPGFDSDIVGNWITNGDIQYNIGSLLGTFTGNKFGEFYEVTGSVRIRVLPLLPKRNVTFTGWVSGNQITTISPQSVDADKKLADDAAFQANLDKITGGKTTATTASSGTATTKNNTMLYVLGGLALLLGGAWLYMNRKKKPAVATALPVVQPLKK